MAEEGQAGASETTETTEAPEGTQTGIDQSGLVNTDGTFLENWSQKLSDETLKGDKTLSTFKNVETLAKSYVHVRRQVPMDKIAIPGKNTTDAEWDEWHIAGGRPQTAADYNLIVPEGLPEGLYTKERIAGAQELFHKIGLSEKQAHALFDLDTSTALNILKSQQQAAEQARSELLDKLYAEWGRATEQRTHWGDFAIDKGVAGNEEFRARLCKKFGNDADFIRFASNLGAQFSERGSITADNILTPADIQAQINEAMAHPAYADAAHPQHKSQNALVRRLYEEKHGERQSRVG